MMEKLRCTLHVYEDSIEIVRLLLGQGGADLEAMDNDVVSPLLINIESHVYDTDRRDLEVVRLMISLGADVEIGHLVSLTPLHLASGRGGTIELMELLLDQGGSNLESRSGGDDTPLQYRLRALEARNEVGSTPLHIACAEGEGNVVRFLLDRGASLEARDNNYNTPLNIACSEGNNVEVVRLLLDRGADVEATNNMGWRSLHIAAVNNCTDIARVLLRRSTVVDATTLAKTTALSLACQMGHVEMVWMLVSQCPWLVDGHGQACVT
ncbi:unnamed protein product [Cylindrotheca closterium]|uniref:Uncharacterized protein n=1 Tax=Cylindrotheca closterium TaxID=2856 RepID=A0AAD2FTW5_9STRA|nr:unnamed protein product [Cylindrotheca closterium]